MADRLVVADGSLLIGLATAGEFHLLRALFGQIRVAGAGRGQVLSGGNFAGLRESREAILAGWAVVVNAPFDAAAFPGLGAVEASTLGRDYMAETGGTTPTAAASSPSRRAC